MPIPFTSSLGRVAGHSRVAVYPAPHADWGLSSRYRGSHPRSYLMDIDGSASTPILEARTPGDVDYLRWEVTTFGYRLFPPGGRALLTVPAAFATTLSFPEFMTAPLSPTPEAEMPTANALAVFGAAATAATVIVPPFTAFTGAWPFGHP